MLYNEWKNEVIRLSFIVFNRNNDLVDGGYPLYTSISRNCGEGYLMRTHGPVCVSMP